MFNEQDRFNRLKVASPCPISWDDMNGDARVRFCNHCQLHVYNISALTRGQLTKLINSHEGKVCGRLFRRADGTVMIKDCPIGLSAIKRKMSRTAAAIFAVIGSCFGLALGQKSDDKASMCRSQIQITRKATSANEAGSIVSGSLFDINGAVITNATVRLVNVHTKKWRQVVSTSEGQFKFIALDPGEYSLEIQAMGFKNYKHTGFKLEDEQMADLNITLVVSEETVVVGLLMEQTSDEPGVKTFQQDYLLKLPLP